jgi:serine/threonine protein phosphatase PrpC
MAGLFLQTLDVAERTDVGLVRKRNEDASKMLIPPPGSPEEAWGALFMVIDGMGGLGGGDVASRYAVQEIARHYYTDGGVDETQTFEPKTRLYKALQAASDTVREQAPLLGLPRIGATAAGVVVSTSGKVLVFSVGDCRVYRLRNGQIEQISRDQSVMQRQIEAGIVPEFSAQSARSSMVTAFLGQPIPLEPNFEEDQAQQNDIYIVCCDGLWSLVDADEIARIVKGAPAEAAAGKLIKLALKRGGHDNVTVIIVRLGKAPSQLGGFLRRLVAALVFAVLLTIGGIALNVFTGGALMGGRGVVPATATPTPSASPSPSPSSSTSPSPSPMPSPTLSPTTLPTATMSPSPSPSQTEAPTSTDTPVPTDTASATLEVAPVIPPPETAAPGATAESTGTPAPTVTLNPYVASYTATLRPTKTHTPSATPTLVVGDYRITGLEPVQAYSLPRVYGTAVRTLLPGEVIKVIEIVQGGSVQGREGTRWLKFIHKQAFAYVHSSYAEFLGAATSQTPPATPPAAQPKSSPGS